MKGLSPHDFKCLTLVLPTSRTPNEATFNRQLQDTAWDISRCLHDFKHLVGAMPTSTAGLWRWLRHQQNLAPGVWASPPLPKNLILRKVGKLFELAEGGGPTITSEGKCWRAITREKDTVLAMP